MTASPALSVVMPAFNAGRFIDEAVASILAQTLGDFELLVFDDASTDDTLTRLQAWAARDARVVVTAGEHRGYCAWLNEGWQRARAPWIARMDADDVALPQRFEWQMARLQRESGLVALGGGFEVIDDEGDPVYVHTPPTGHADLLAGLMGGQGSQLCHPAVILNRVALARVGGYRQAYESAEDVDLFLRLADIGTLGAVPDVVLRYRWHLRSVSHERRARQQEILREIVPAAWQRRGQPVPAVVRELLATAEARAAQPNTLRQLQEKIIWLARHQGNFATARKHARRLLRREWRDRGVWRLWLESCRPLPTHPQASTVSASEPSPAQAEAVRELTRLLEANPAFSYVRLGDGEVQWMQLARRGEASHRYQYEDSSEASIERVRGVTGMEPRHLARFERAMREADYVDFCDSIPPVQAYLREFPLARRRDGHRNPSAAASNLVFAWTHLELGGYLASHRCLFAGAEAALLAALWEDPEYRACAMPTIPSEARAWFHQVRDNGRRYSENLDLIKADLVAAIRADGIDTLFLSLGTGAKILAQEIAVEHRVRVLDFGSMMRGLTYAGSSGYQAHRDMHNPFFFRVPFPVHLRAAERAFASFSPAELAGKAYAQLALELHPHRRFQFNTSDGVAGGQLDLSEENLTAFRAAWRAYRTGWWPQWRTTPAVAALDAEFRHWLRKHGIGWSGFWYRRLVAGKALLRRIGWVK